MKKKKWLSVILILSIYFLMITGGIWHILDRFQNEMRVMASPLLILLSCIVFYDYWRQSHKRSRVIIWGVLVIFSGIIIEWVGVNTGMIFGVYSYGDTLQPQIAGIPVAIGFAWLNIEICSLVLAQKISGQKYMLAALTALFMVLFDLSMEAPAGELGYWSWHHSIPFQNFLAWFVLGFLLLLLGQKLEAVEENKSPLIIHIYFAQMVFFLLIMFSL